MSAPTINPGPVLCAGDAPTIESAQTTLPSMRGTVIGWFKPLKIGVVQTSIADEGPEDGQVQEVLRWIETSGVLQPGSPENLSVQPEGERSWENAVLHVFPQLNVPTGTKLQIAGMKFEVMARWDYSVNGYVKYELVQSFACAPTT